MCDCPTGLIACVGSLCRCRDQLLHLQSLTTKVKKTMASKLGDRCGVLTSDIQKASCPQTTEHLVTEKEVVKGLTPTHF